MSTSVPWQVEYQCDGFLEKNRDTVYEEQINILKASKVRENNVLTPRAQYHSHNNTPAYFLYHIVDTSHTKHTAHLTGERSLFLSFT